jgi:hypothetical protein
MTDVLNRTLGHMNYGEPQHFRNLCVVPLFNGGGGGPVYRTLREALDRGEVEVTEVSEGGQVPHLKVSNQADAPLVLVDGEELAGAKQNRIVNTTLMLEAHSETIIPVSCTEAGRWGYTSRRFDDSGVVMSARARYGKSARLLYNLRMNAGYDAGQSEVWRDIDKLHDKLGSRSRTAAMKDAYIQRDQELKDYLAAFPLIEGQQGLVVFLNGVAVGADYLSRPDAYSGLHSKFLQSHIIEAIGEEDKSLLAEWKVDALLFLQTILSAKEVSRHQPVGLGQDLRLEGDRTNGSALIHEDTVIHLSVYAKNMINDQKEDFEHEMVGTPLFFFRRWRPRQEQHAPPPQGERVGG